MQESISLDVLTNWVVMLRADIDGAVWLADDNVEARFYEKIAHKTSRIVPAQNVALPLLDSVEQRGVHGVVAAVAGIATAEDAHNIFRPSQGDVLLLLFMSAESPRVMQEICGGDWLSACEKELGSIRHRLVNLASAFGRLRMACDPKNAYFKAEQLCELVDWTRCEIDWHRVDTLIGADLSARIRPACDDLTCDTVTLARQCLGLDAIQLFSAATRLYRPRGIEPRGNIDSDSFMGMLRVAFNPNEIEGDELFWKMKRWIRSNPKYPLLRGWRDLDPLGVVWDQRYWQEDLLAMLRGLDPGALLTVLKMDLDNFKAVNEHCGHTIGDEAIRLYCNIVRDVLGPFAEVYRRGGDEIIALAPSLSEGAARQLAEKTREEVEAQFKPWASDRGLKVGPTASIGVTLADREQPSENILALVDRAQKRAKDQGKNCVVVER